ncbi:hypothetical protein [Salinivibrio sp. ES.052]|uniref:hypothetical protein n=1 Tax=Salinivibrio sp. ES.052 TaxID=1882823 RepID=UPI00092C15F0|nr:hypothetical protein [Salinivibrio sp. ES.052]SIN90938.1 hypothetical protein SAMN05444724_1164 [Salinivibrio sp. ES.052]
MNTYLRLIMLSSGLLMVGCTSYDSSSQFDDVVKSITERHNYVQITTKSITPETQALVGADIVKAASHYVGHYSTSDAGKAGQAPSKLITEVSFFKNYQEFNSVAINGETIELENMRVTSETCTEHCVTTQYVAFPFSPETVANWSEPQVRFVFSNTGGSNRVQFSIPKAYFTAANEEAARVVGQRINPSVVARGPETSEKVAQHPEAMIDYWYQKANENDRNVFADWAFANRDGSGALPTTQSQPLQMMGYWYQQATPTSRKAILTWLLNQS